MKATLFQKLNYWQIRFCSYYAFFTNHFQFLKGRYFVMDGSIDTSVGVFSETSVGFLKGAVLQFSPKYGQSYANLNVKSRPKFNRPLKIDRLS